MTLTKLTGPFTSVERFEAMVRMRHFEEACLDGVPTREIHGELHLAIGQEAIAAGMLGPLTDDDALVSTHRNHLHALAKGVSPRALLAEIYEKAEGLCGGFGGHMHPFDPARNFSASGIVGASLPVAAGYAYAHRMDGRDAIAVAMIGDAGTNIGSFHETLVMAGAWKLPLVIVVENNGYGISVPIDRVTAPGGLGVRAGAYGCRTDLVDGTNPDLVASAFAAAVDHARAGHGPALVEAICARFRGHFEGDTDHYRRPDERARDQADRDPLLRGRAALTAADPSCGAALDTLIDTSKRETDDLLAEVRAMASPDPQSARNHVFSEAA